MFSNIIFLQTTHTKWKVCSKTFTELASDKGKHGIQLLSKIVFLQPCPWSNRVVFHSSNSKLLLAADRGSLSLQLAYQTCCLMSSVLQPSQASFSLRPTNSDFLQALPSRPEACQQWLCTISAPESMQQRPTEQPHRYQEVYTVHWDKGNVCSWSTYQDLNLACSEHKCSITCNC